MVCGRLRQISDIILPNMNHPFLYRDSLFSAINFQIKLKDRKKPCFHLKKQGNFYAFLRLRVSIAVPASISVANHSAIWLLSPVCGKSTSGSSSQVISNGLNEETRIQSPCFLKSISPFSDL